MSAPESTPRPPVPEEGLDLTGRQWTRDFWGPWWSLVSQLIQEINRLRARPPSPAVPTPDPNWQAEREMGPIAINRDLWRSLHDLCRIVRSTSGESIHSILTAYLAGSFDDFGLKVNLAHPMMPPPAGPDTLTEKELDFLDKGAGLCGPTDVRRLIAEIRRMRSPSQAPDALTWTRAMTEARRYLLTEIFDCEEAVRRLVDMAADDEAPNPNDIIECATPLRILLTKLNPASEVPTIDPMKAWESGMGLFPEDVGVLSPEYQKNMLAKHLGIHPSRITAFDAQTVTFITKPPEPRGPSQASHIEGEAK